MRNLAIIIFCASVAFTSCDDSTFDLAELTFEEFSFDFNCYESISEEKVVINDQNTFQELLDTTFQNNGSCDTTNLPSIDFTQYTLLGTFRDASGCTQEFIKNLYIDEDNQKYVYNVTVEEEGGCLPYVTSMNWILAPKLPEGYTVEFLEEE